MKIFQLLPAAIIAVIPLCAHANFIGFEEFGNVSLTGPTITNQYAGVVFSSVNGNVNAVSSQNNIGFGLNFLCTSLGSINCTGETILTFVSAVNDLSFWAVGSNNSGVTAKVDVFTNGVFTTTQDINTGGIFSTPDLVNLALFAQVTSIRIYGITDGGGLGWDNFTFTPTEVSSVPLPATLPLMISGLGVFWFSIRRRKMEV